MPKEFVMRGQIVSSGEETIQMAGLGSSKPGYGYQMTSFRIWPAVPSLAVNLHAAITAENVYANPVAVNFNNDGLIGVASYVSHSSTDHAGFSDSLVNDMYVITQNLLMSARDLDSSTAINWQMKFREVKLSPSAHAVANYKQFTVYNTG